MKSKVVKVKKENMDIIYGLIIGDGSLYKGKRGNALLDIAHCKEQKEYLEVKADLLKEISNIEVIIKEKPPTKNSNFLKYRFRTPKNKLWTELMAELYSFRNTDNKKRKRITKNILKKFTIRTLCLWYMDDGYNCKNRNYIHLGIYGFTLEEAELIKDWIYEITNCEFKIYKRKDKPFLVCYKDAQKFKNLLKNNCDFIPKCMEYKFI